MLYSHLFVCTIGFVIIVGYNQLCTEQLLVEGNTGLKIIFTRSEGFTELSCKVYCINWHSTTSFSTTSVKGPHIT